MRRASGATMAVVLMIVMLAAVLAFTLAGTGIFHLNVCTREDNSLQARNFAESSISQGIERVIHKNDYGVARDMTIEVPHDGVAAGELTFDIDDAKKRDIPYSTNNIANNASVDGWNGRTVSRNSLHLVGVGHCNGVTKRVEAVIHIPPFPYCVASSGKFSSGGKLLVGSVGSAAEIEHGIDPKKLQPGHMVSNSTSSDAIVLDGEGKITGDLQSAGDITFDPGSSIEVLGEIRRHARPADLLPIKITSYDPKDKAGVKNLPGFLDNPTLDGFCRVQGNFSVAGNLELHGSMLYVDGDLTVIKGVKGKGALVVTGKTTIGKGADITSDNLVALLSQGDVTLGSPGAADTSSFQGIVYTEGNFKADNMSLLGAFLTRGPTTSLGNIAFNNVTCISVPDYTSINIESQSTQRTRFRMCEMSTCGTDKYIDASWNPLWQINCRPDGRFDLAQVDPKTNAVTVVNTFEKIESDQSEVQEQPTRYIADYFEIPWAQNLEKTDMEAYNICLAHGMLSCNHLSTYLQQFKNPVESTGGDSGPLSVFALDISQFLNLEDRMRIILWREL
jgi:hypothetical protein